MIVKLNTIDEFLDELKDAGRPGVIAHTVRFQVNRTAKQKSAITHQVDVWVTALMLMKHDDEQGEYLLELGMAMGQDGDLDEGEESGSDRAEAVRVKLADCCDDIGLRLRAGKIEV